jgi:hypothetical protein
MKTKSRLKLVGLLLGVMIAILSFISTLDQTKYQMERKSTQEVSSVLVDSK